MQVNENTVTIKKSPRSTFDHYHTVKGSGRIGDLNVVWRKMLMPSDMIRCRVSSSIQFISPLSVPAFARMKVYTYYFFCPYQNVQSDFNDAIMNYMHESKASVMDGQFISSSNYLLSNIKISDIEQYLNSPYYYKNYEGSIYHSSDDNSFKATLQQTFPDKYNYVYATQNQRNNIVRLLNQIGLPFSLTLLPPPRWTAGELVTLATYANSQYEVDATNSSVISFLKDHQNYNYFKGKKNYAGDYPYFEFLQITGDTNFKINVLPFKCYQSIYNDWFNNSLTNSPIDIFSDTVNFNLSLTSFTYNNTNVLFYFVGNLGLITLADADNVEGVEYDDFPIFPADYRDNYLMNSLFQIRQPWYAKDYFNTASADPTLGVSPYSVGSSILDLRKNSALQRLAEKKALCGNKFVDFIVQHFNIYPPDLEIERSIHLSTSVSYVTINEVLQTSETTPNSPQGERAAVARSNGSSKGVFFKAPTYGDFQVLQCIKPEIDYFNGVPRELTVVDVADVPLPELAQIGMDTILKRELNCSGLKGYDFNSTFGYSPRYSFQKMSLNRVTGRLAYDLEFWHQSPDLRLTHANLNYRFGQIGFDVDSNTGFVTATSDEFPTTDNPAFNRIFAVTDINEDTYVFLHEIYATINTCLPSNDMPQL